jgi:hypothetical protein
MLLNLALLAIAALLAVQFRREWQAAGARERAVLDKKVSPSPAPGFTPYPKPEALTAAQYAAVANQNLFSKDRNSNVIIDVTPPPPPKPVPPFPVAHGVMLWDGVPPTVVLSDKSSGAQRSYHPGEKFGEWQIVSVDNQFLVLQWDGKEYKKRLDELLDKTTLTSAQAQAPGPAPSSGAQTTTLTPSVQTFTSKSPEGPGVDIGGEVRACTPGDSSPPGTISGGLKKVVSATPFGSVCRWEPVK